MTNYELIVCIINAGFSDTVMQAAKEQGARGGTVLHARGTANKEAEEFFHITVQPDKEVVMILVPCEIRDAVLHAVYQAAGLKTAGQGISFALPVTDTVGLTPASEVAATVAATDTREHSSTGPAEEQAAAEERSNGQNDPDDAAL